MRAIHAETAGNPFYVREVFRHLVEEGKIVRRDGRWSTDFSIAALGIPEGVRQVVERRVGRALGRRPAGCSEPRRRSPAASRSPSCHR